MSAFRVRPGKPVAHELARVMDAQIKRAREQLADWPSDPEAAFHNVRRRLKKVRTAARLARAIDEPFARAINACAREASRALSSVRDSDVVHATALKLSRSIGDDDAAAALERFARHAERTAPAKKDRGVLADRADKILGDTRSVVKRLGGADAPRKALRGGAAKALRRADDAFLKAHIVGATVGEAAEEIRHEWRKRVKDVWHVERLLRDVWPLDRHVDDELVSELGAILGDERDIFLLASQLHGAARACGGIGPRDAARASLETERRRLYAAARRLGLRVHGVEPLPLHAAAARADNVIVTAPPGGPAARRRKS